MKPRPLLSTKAWGGPHLKNGKPRAEHWRDSAPEETTHRSETPGSAQWAPGNCRHHTHFSLLGSEGLGVPQVPASLSKYALQYHQVLKQGWVPQHSFVFKKTKIRKKRSIITQEPFLSESLFPLTGGLILNIIFKEVSALWFLFSQLFGLLIS